MHYYQFNIGDYASHTSHLTETEDLAYRRMLDYCYLNECGLPESIDRIARVIRMPQHCQSIATVLLEYFTQHTDGTYRQVRIDKEIEAYKGKSKAASDKANKRWKKGDAVAMPMQCQSNAKQETLNINHKPIIKDLVSPKAQPSKSGTRLPVDWTVQESWFDDAMEIGLDAITIHSEAIVFRDYWHGVAGAKGRKADWRATWRNWIRRKMETSNRNLSHAERKHQRAEHNARRDYSPATAQDF